MYIYMYIYIYTYMYIYIYIYIYYITAGEAVSFHRKGGWYGWKPSSSSNFSFELFELNFSIRVFELILLLKLDKRFPVEQFEATVASQSAAPSTPLRSFLTGAIWRGGPPVLLMMILMIIVTIVLIAVVIAVVINMW